MQALQSVTTFTETGLGPEAKEHRLCAWLNEKRVHAKSVAEEYDEYYIEKNRDDVVAGKCSG